MWVLDTNTLIYFFKGMGKVADNLLSRPPKDIGIPAIVLYELEVGIAKSTSPGVRTRQLEQLLSAINLLPFSETEAKAAARIRANLEKKGTPIGPHDVLIAGTAVTHGAILVTRNVREFRRVKDLRIENWY